MARTNIQHTKEWLTDCIKFGPCSSCPRWNVNCINAKTVTEKALEAILELETQIAKLKGEKVPNRAVEGQMEALRKMSLEMAEKRRKDSLPKRTRKSKTSNSATADTIATTPKPTLKNSKG